MLSSLRFKGTLSQIMHATYPIVYFPVLVPTFYVKVLFRCIPGIVLCYCIVVNGQWSVLTTEYSVVSRQ